MTSHQIARCNINIAEDSFNINQSYLPTAAMYNILFCNLWRQIKSEAVLNVAEDSSNSLWHNFSFCNLWRHIKSEAVLNVAEDSSNSLWHNFSFCNLWRHIKSEAVLNVAEDSSTSLWRNFSLHQQLAWPNKSRRYGSSADNVRPGAVDTDTTISSSAYHDRQ